MHILEQNGFWLDEESIPKAQEAGDAWLGTWQKLAEYADTHDLAMFKIIPKTHYVTHMSDGQGCVLMSTHQQFNMGLAPADGDKSEGLVAGWIAGWVGGDPGGSPWYAPSPHHAHPQYPRSRPHTLPLPQPPPHPRGSEVEGRQRTTADDDGRRRRQCM